MPANSAFAARLLAVLSLLVIVAAALAGQPPDPGKKPADPPPPKAIAAPAPKDKEPVKTPPQVGTPLPDGTFQWTGPGAPPKDGDRVWVSPQEIQKLLDQIDQLKKQLAARKPVSPSGCAIRCQVEKRGEALVAAITATYTFRTTTPNTAIALGGKRAFLVAATLDKAPIPPLDSGDDGFAVLVEVPGDHTVSVSLEAPVTSRGAKAELGFELGLPRAAITTLTLGPPAGVSRVTLVTRTPDPTQLGKPAEPRRAPALDVGQLAAKPGYEGYPLGPVESLEVIWAPPAAPVADPALSAEWEISCLLAEGFVETTAKLHPRGLARGWKVAAPADAVFSVDQASPTRAPAVGPGSDVAPIVTKPTDPNKPIWKVEFPAGSPASDWVVTAVVRGSRAGVNDPKHKGPFPIGPFTAVGVSRQTGTIRITAAPNTRLTVIRPALDLRQEAPSTQPTAETVSLFRFATGPTGDSAPTGPLLNVEARLLEGAVQVQPTYRLILTESGWQVRADLRVFPIRREVTSLPIQFPADWRGFSASPREDVDGLQPGKVNGPWQEQTVQLATGHRQPFALVITATVPVPHGATEAAILFPRFPDAGERDTTLQVFVSDGLEVRGVGREWEGDQPGGWGQPLVTPPGTDGKPTRARTAVSGRFEAGLARADLAWGPHQPELAADIRAEVWAHDDQVVVTEQVRLRAPDGFTRPVRFHGPASLRDLPPLTYRGPGEWHATPSPDSKEVTFSFTYAVPVPSRPAAGAGPWSVPVGLVWPTAATQTETVVRVWSTGGAGHSVRVPLGAWRELPPEPVAGRDVLPTLTLAGAGADLPLVLTLSDPGNAAAVSEWVERGLIQVWLGADDSAVCRARFLLSRWLTDAIVIEMPEGTAILVTEAWIDGRKVDPIPVGGQNLRLLLPAARPGRTVVVELSYHLAPGAARLGLVAPHPRASIAGPVRWHVAVPAGTIPLVTGGGTAEQGWALRSGLFAPITAAPEDLDRWFQTGTESDDGAGTVGAVVVRATGSGPVMVSQFPRIGLIVLCSIGALIVGLVVTRLPSRACGPAVALVGGVVAVVAVLFPQPAGQVVAAAEPGLATLVMVLGIMAAARWYYRRRITHLTGFTRVHPIDTAASTTGSQASARSRSSQHASSGARV